MIFHLVNRPISRPVVRARARGTAPSDRGSVVRHRLSRKTTYTTKFYPVANRQRKMLKQEALGSQDQMNLEDGMRAERNGTELIGSNGK